MNKLVKKILTRIHNKNVEINRDTFYEFSSIPAETIDNTLGNFEQVVTQHGYKIEISSPNIQLL